MQQGDLVYPNKGEKVSERHFLVRLYLGKEVLDFLTNEHFIIARLWKGRSSAMKFLSGQAIQMIGIDSRLFGDAPSRKVVLCGRLCVDISIAARRRWSIQVSQKLFHREGGHKDNRDGISIPTKAARCDTVSS